MLAYGILANLLYPAACPICQGRLPSSRSRCCEACLRGMQRNGPPVCSRCGLGLAGAFDAHLECARCRTRPPAFESARASWQYVGVARYAIHHFKYRRHRRIGRWLADDMARLARSSLPLEEIDAVVPVPLHWIKRRLRGFDPVEELARRLAQRLDKPLARGALCHTRWTRTQTRIPGPQRLSNVRGAFAARPRWAAPQAVLLVDDVMTSGATAHMCTLALKAAGARQVFVLTAARTPRD